MLLTAIQYAKERGVSRSTVYRWIAEQKIKVQDCCGKIMIVVDGGKQNVKGGAVPHHEGK